MESLFAKIRKPGANYQQLSEITDLAGIRIICFFEDEVNTISNIICDEFAIDKMNSIDKRALLDPDRFGYLSVHHIIQLTKQRASLTEYKEYKSLKMEIQIRSILQHAWAEIEHDLGYKTHISVPSDVRRRFSRLAGLLELADQEFVALRTNLDAYKQGLPNRLETVKQEVKIDRDSLTVFIESNEIIRDIASKIAASIKVEIENKVQKTIIEYYPAVLAEFRIHNICDLEESLKNNRMYIIEFAKEWIGLDHEISSIDRSFVIFYLVYCLIAETDNIDFIDNFLEYHMWGEPSERTEMANKIVDLYKRIRQSHLKAHISQKRILKK